MKYEIPGGGVLSNCNDQSNEALNGAEWPSETVWFTVRITLWSKGDIYNCKFVSHSLQFYFQTACQWWWYRCQCKTQKLKMHRILPFLLLLYSGGTQVIATTSTTCNSLPSFENLDQGDQYFYFGCSCSSQNRYKVMLASFWAHYHHNHHQQQKHIDSFYPFKIRIPFKRH